MKPQDNKTETTTTKQDAAPPYSRTLLSLCFVEDHDIAGRLNRLWKVGPDCQSITIDGDHVVIVRNNKATWVHHSRVQLATSDVVKA